MPRGAKPGERRGGRAKGTLNKNTLDIRALAQKYGPELVTILVQIAKDEETPQAARVSAIKEALDRGYGKPAQTQIIQGDEEGGPVRQVIDGDSARDEIARRIASVASRIGTGQNTGGPH